MRGLRDGVVERRLAERRHDLVQGGIESARSEVKSVTRSSCVSNT
jgi:hypothetical protein